jgi:hypothetical protein
MTRESLGVVLALAGVLPLGAGILMLTRTPLRLWMAVFAGLAATEVLLPPLVYLGIGPSVPVVLGAGIVVLALGLGIGEAIGERPRLEPLPALVLAAPLALLAARGIDAPVDKYDAWSNWTLKAKLLYADRDFLHASLAPPVHREYPLGLPSLEAYVMHAMGRADARVLHLLFVVFLAGLAAFAWHVLRPHVDTLPLTIGLSVVLWLPAVRDQALSEYADVPLACLFVAAVLLVGSGRVELGSVFAAAALATKRDALAFVVVLYALALVRGERRRVLIAAGAVAVSAVPWFVFSATHDLRERDIALSTAHTGELSFVLRHIWDVLVDGAYLGVVPLAAVTAAVLVVRRGERLLGLGFLALLFGVLAALVVVYLSGTTGVRYLVSSTVERTLVTPTLLAATLLPLLLTRALAGSLRSGSSRARRTASSEQR